MTSLPLSDTAPGWVFGEYSVGGNAAVVRVGNAMRVEFDLEAVDGLRARTTDLVRLDYSYFVEYGNVTVPGNVIAIENEIATCSVTPGHIVVNGIAYDDPGIDPNDLTCCPLDAEVTANATLWGFGVVRDGVPQLRHYWTV